MHRGKSTTCREHMITVSSSSNDENNNVLLGAYQEEAFTLTHDVASLNVVPQCRVSVPS